MRRNEKEIMDQNDITQIIQSAEICRIALVDKDKPYIVPVCFGYEDNCLYIHSAGKGKKIDIINKNPNVCFEIEADCHLKPGTNESACDWTMKFRSIIGFGKAFLIQSRQEIKDALDIIMEHYSTRENFKYNDRSLEKIAIIKIAIDSMTGKQSGYLMKTVQ